MPPEPARKPSLKSVDRLPMRRITRREMAGRTDAQKDGRKNGGRESKRARERERERERSFVRFPFLISKRSTAKQYSVESMPLDVPSHPTRKCTALSKDFHTLFELNFHLRWGICRICSGPLPSTPHGSSDCTAPCLPSYRGRSRPGGLCRLPRSQTIRWNSVGWGCIAGWVGWALIDPKTGTKGVNVCP